MFIAQISKGRTVREFIIDVLLIPTLVTAVWMSTFGLTAPVVQRVFWALAEGFLTIALLYVGAADALSALQAGSIATALPFTFILLMICFSLYRGLKSELKMSSY